jgi:hypothetical protein
MMVVISRFEEHDGVGSLHRVEGKIDQFMYKNIVHMFMNLPFTKQNKLAGGYISRTVNGNTHLAMLRIGAQRNKFELRSGRRKVQT